MCSMFSLFGLEVGSWKLFAPCVCACVCRQLALFAGELTFGSREEIYMKTRRSGLRRAHSKMAWSNYFY